jgi:histidine triad (HIT) family protein
MVTTGTASECLFCRIGTKEVPADIVHESDHVVAFRDINPQAPTHILVIPKEHLDSLAEVSREHAGLLAEMLETATHLAKAEGIDGSGWRLVANVGREGGQTVEHLHFHLLGGRAMRWPPG